MSIKSKILQSFYKQYPDYESVYLTHYGSKLYGTDSETSDTDIKGIFIPTERDVLLKKDPDHWSMNTNNTIEKNTSEDIDCQLFSIYKFFSLLEKGDTGSLDILFSMFRGETIIHDDHDFTKMMKLHYKEFLSKNLGAFKGYCLGQAKRFGIKGQRYDELEKFVLHLQSFSTVLVLQSPINVHFNKFKLFFAEIDAKYLSISNLEDGSKRNGNEPAKSVEYLTVLGRNFIGTVSYGYLLNKLTEILDTFGHRTKKAATDNYVDNKALSHAVRIMTELEELLDTSMIRFPLKNAEEIKRIKYTILEQEEYAEIMDNLNAKLDIIDTKIKESKMPEFSNKKSIQDIILYYVRLQK